MSLLLPPSGGLLVACRAAQLALWHGLFLWVRHVCPFYGSDHLLLTREDSRARIPRAYAYCPRRQHNTAPMLQERRRSMHAFYSSWLRRLVMWSFLGWGLGLGGFLGLGGCALPPPYPPPSPPASPPPDETWARATYQLTVGDRVRFINEGIPELSCEVRVAADGTVVYPYVGTVQARGRTVVQLETELETELGQRLAAGLKRIDLHRLDLHADVIAY